jgi:hypothetical protein
MFRITNKKELELFYVIFSFNSITNFLIDCFDSGQTHFSYRLEKGVIKKVQQFWVGEES